MNAFSRTTTLSRKVTYFGYGGCSLLVMMGCSRTFITNNYTMSDAANAPSEETVVTIDAAQNDASMDAALVDAVAPMSSGVDSGVDAAPSPIDAALVDADSRDGGDAHAALPLAPGVPVVNVGVENQQISVFGTFNNHYWFVATEDQVNAINSEFQGVGGGHYGGYGGDIYAPNSGKPIEVINAVDHLVITTPDNQTADYGQMKVKLVGQSTGRTWTDTTLPNFKLDADDITAGMRIGGYEHFRLNNAIMGTIFREKFVYDFYNALGYPAPLSSYAWVSTTVWGPNIKVPYIVTESYKRGFCKQRPEFGGECPNMYEFARDFGYGVFGYEENCQFDACDSTRASEFEAAVVDVRNGGATTLTDLGAYVDWDKFHQFQCLAWIFGTTDSPPLASNNTVWAERADGKFQMLPYSIDISLSLFNGPYWYDTGLYGNTMLASMCQSDEECWADTITACEDMITKFTALDPVGRLDQLHAELDEGRYNDLRVVLGQMVSQLPTALDNYREPRSASDICSNYGMVDCGGSCQYAQYCYLCDDAYYEDPDNFPVPGMSGGPIVGPAPSMDIAPPPPQGGAPTTAVATDAGVETTVEDDAGEIPVKPDFCYYNGVGVKNQEVYVLP
jgi:hypothetical protein